MEETTGKQTEVQPGFQCPSWLHGGLMYQIFPDRFARDPGYFPTRPKKSYVMRPDWGGTPNGAPDEKGIVQNNDFFGGNLRGICGKLPYLKDLGVTVLYLNPVFEAYSNHRYDTADYHCIDPILGTEQDLISLCEQAKAYGMRVILDGVFNHTGSDSIYFNQNKTYPGLGAAQGPNSPYYSWYRFTKFPDQYESWWGIKTLPSVNEEEPSYLDFIIRDEHSVIRHWLKCGISGYRLDVVDELPDVFLDELRVAVKSFHPDAAIIGEVWENAATKVSYGEKRRYLDGRQLDSVMNYPLRTAILRYLNEDGDAKLFAKQILELWTDYPKTVFYGVMNFLGTHDTPRILTVFSEGRDRQSALARLFSSLFLWGFLPGIPCIYYGDEIGMHGGKDPDNRKCFVEKQADQEIFRFYKRFLTFRAAVNECDDLGEMEFLPLPAEGGLYRFLRTGTRCRLIVAVNGGNEPANVPLDLAQDERLEDFILSGQAGFSDMETFRLNGISAICAFITKKETR